MPTDKSASKLLKQREYAKRYRARIKADPARLEEWHRRYPIEVRREYSRKFLERVRSDPGRLAEHRRQGVANTRASRAKPGRDQERRARRADYKLAIINHYSGGSNSCACCGETHVEFLTIDHINGDGAAHRRRVRNVYAWLKRNGYPPGFQVLCMNCNFARGRFGYCPHSKSPAVLP